MAKSFIEIKSQLDKISNRSKRNYTIDQGGFFKVISNLLDTLIDGMKRIFSDQFSSEFS